MSANMSTKCNTCSQCVFSRYDDDAKVTECYAMPPVVLYDAEEDCPCSIRPIVGAKDLACSLFRHAMPH